jgi:hypothetical protein
MLLISRQININTEPKTAKRFENKPLFDYPSLSNSFSSRGIKFPGPTNSESTDFNHIKTMEAVSSSLRDDESSHLLGIYVGLSRGENRSEA